MKTWKNRRRHSKPRLTKTVRGGVQNKDGSHDIRKEKAAAYRDILEIYAPTLLPLLDNTSALTGRVSLSKNDYDAVMKVIKAHPLPPPKKSPFGAPSAPAPAPSLATTANPLANIRQPDVLPGFGTSAAALPSTSVSALNPMRAPGVSARPSAANVSESAPFGDGADARLTTALGENPLFRSSPAARAAPPVDPFGDGADSRLAAIPGQSPLFNPPRSAPAAPPGSAPAAPASDRSGLTDATRLHGVSGTSPRMTIDQCYAAVRDLQSRLDADTDRFKAVISEKTSALDRAAAELDEKNRELADAVRLRDLANQARDLSARAAADVADAVRTGNQTTIEAMTASLQQLTDELGEKTEIGGQLTELIKIISESRTQPSPELMSAIEGLRESIRASAAVALEREAGITREADAARAERARELDGIRSVHQAEVRALEARITEANQLRAQAEGSKDADKKRAADLDRELASLQATLDGQRAIAAAAAETAARAIAELRASVDTKTREADAAQASASQASTAAAAAVASRDAMTEQNTTLAQRIAAAEAARDTSTAAAADASAAAAAAEATKETSRLASEAALAGLRADLDRATAAVAATRGEERAQAQAQLAAAQGRYDASLGEARTRITDLDRRLAAAVAAQADAAEAARTAEDALRDAKRTDRPIITGIIHDDDSPVTDANPALEGQYVRMLWNPSRYHNTDNVLLLVLDDTGTVVDQKFISRLTVGTTVNPDGSVTKFAPYTMISGGSYNIRILDVIV